MASKESEISFGDSWKEAGKAILIGGAIIGGIIWLIGRIAAL